MWPLARPSPGGNLARRYDLHGSWFGLGTLPMMLGISLPGRAFPLAFRLDSAGDTGSRLPPG